MSPNFSRRTFLGGTGALGLLSALAACSPAGSNPIRGLPEQTVWSTYAVGTGTYNDVAAIADTFTSQTGLQVRLLSSSTGVGRIGPVVTETAQFGRVSLEYYYAFEGEDEFCSAEWGPQPVRLVWTPPGNYGMVVRQDSGIETVEDLRDRRVPYVIGNTPVNRNIEAILSYGGLTYDDVRLVDIGYGEQGDALRTGQLETMFENPTGAAVQELATEYPVRWLDLHETDAWRFEHWERLVPTATIDTFSGGAGMEEGDSATSLSYSIPLVTIADQSADTVYSFVSLLTEHFEHFRDTTQDTPNFGVDELLLNPLAVPFHEGTIRLLDELGHWTPDLQARNDALLDREQRINQAWPDFWDTYGHRDNPSPIWQEWKRENLPELPQIADVDDDSPVT